MATSTTALSASVLLAGWVVLAWWLADRARRRDGRPSALVADLAVPVAAWALGVVVLLNVAVLAGQPLWRLYSYLYLAVVVTVPLVAVVALVLVGAEALARARRPRSTTDPVGAPPEAVPGGGPADVRPAHGGTTDRRPADRPRRLVVAVAVLGLVPAAVGWHTTRVAPHDLRVDEVALAVPDAAGGDVVRIGVLADLQTERVTDYERRAVATLAEERPDVVLVAGDLFQGSDAAFAEDRDELVALLSSLEAPGGVFVVTGDVDRRDRLARLAADAGITHLDDRTTEVEVGDRRLRITGVPLRHRRGSEALDRLEPADDGTISILVAHRPDWVLVADPATIDLVVAGHTHGGQVQLPWIGPLVTHSAVPRHVAAGGLHEVRGIPTYVSTGVGHQQQGAPQVRFLARPSVGIIELTG